MKRLFPILLMICISLSFFSACAKKPDILIDENDGGLDFNGNKIVIALGPYMWNYPPERGGSASSDRLLDRYEETQKEFNFTFDFLEGINPATHFLSAALSGSMQADFLYCSNSQIYDAYLINTLLPIENVIDDPESDKWKSPANNGKGLYGGKMYALFPNHWDSSPGIFGMITINTDLLDEYDIASPIDIIESGEWDWENFRAFLRQTAFKDGEKEWLGMGMGINGVGVACIFPFVLTNGGSFMKETDGRYTLEINSPEAMEAYEYIADLGSEGLITEVPNSDPSYNNGEKWMLTSGGAGTSDEFNVAQVRYPYGPSGSKDTVSTISLGYTMWAFPIFSAYTEDEIGEVAEFMFEPLDASLYPNGWKDYMKDNIFTYDSEYEYYIKGVDRAEYIDMDILNDSFWKLSNAMYDIFKGNQSPTNAIDAVYDVIFEEINEKYNR